MRIGYFGGTFDPPHRAHLRVAQAAADAYNLDRILLAPTGHQPLKSHDAFASYEDRLAMTRLLCADDPRLEVSELDAPHADGSPNFTVEALQTLQKEQPNAELFVIAGADSFLTLRSWRDSEQLLQMADWIVAARPETSLDDLSVLALSQDERKRVHLLTSIDEDISSTGIRERLRVGVACDKLLTPTVNLYIARMHLYHAR